MGPKPKDMAGYSITIYYEHSFVKNVWRWLHGKGWNRVEIYS